MCSGVDFTTIKHIVGADLQENWLFIEQNLHPVQNKLDLCIAASYKILSDLYNRLHGSVQRRDTMMQGAILKQD